MTNNFTQIIVFIVILGVCVCNDVHSSDVPPAPPQPIAISIARDGFHPVHMRVAAISSDEALVQLTHDKPNIIKNVPAFSGRERLYGFMRIGEGSNSLFALILDVYPDESFLFLDQNQNLDLTDDPEPQINLGSGIFATEVEIPFRTLSHRYPFFPENFQIWVFTNSSLWPKRRLTHYSRTQLSGTVALDGVPFNAWIVDIGGNDANLTNDGICLDLDRNRKIEKGECFLPYQTAVVNGRKYIFKVSW